MATVRIAHGEPRHRALPLRLHGQPGIDSLSELLEWPPSDTIAVGAPEDLVTCLRRAAGARVTGIDIDLSTTEVAGTSAPAAPAREHGSSGRNQRTFRSSLRPVSHRPGPRPGAGLGRPVDVADPLMERFTVPVEDGDLLSPFLDVWPPLVPRRRVVDPAAGGPDRRQPRNMGFTDGLDRWDLDRGSLGVAGGQAVPAGHGTDYAAAAGDGSAVLLSEVPEPHGSGPMRGHRSRRGRPGRLRVRRLLSRRPPRTPPRRSELCARPV